ncbi:MAG: hypothetical protein COW00_01180 [Bdellovibrio sp. CG12_big_fil_rev_8_21_14_0_65_39_13]|nr:MAG: hypothetical protein COW78_10470 [Bdellovibrio sp. CG22_combo_CG10-13_8_21_14_all_39_27]PIQ62765.1 MAG: hypothetical protein COW00_01180 [Bdellovibrio sp. CG12_big_fil_rev_8_21_14_0_65_39_13]PIR36086.1 MAG: hypothetical protein COV37_05395 [Bdellovibrio sp. CG11_big_fil_rev_8_21_14_0_20_39_38]PJB53699.1 MAG: hypothetical protein CO099_05675 [Bdellovibrio sp. CG_4_9_14_3_um_filter_39_7]
MVELTANEKRNFSNRVTITGSVVDAINGILKLTAGIMSQSQSMIVDGLHSFSDLFTDIFVIFINRYSHEEPDAEHPYGHQRIETLGTLAMGSTLLFVAGAFAYENVIKLYSGGSDLKVNFVSFSITLFSIVSKEGIFHYISRAAKKIKSPLLEASAWHSRTDAFSSLVVMIGLIFSYYGYTWFDSVAAIIVAILIGRIGWNFMKDSLVELADTSISNERMKEYMECIMKIDGVIDAHSLRSRRMGNKAILDVNVQVNQRITASEGHEISSWVAKKLIDQFEEVIDVTVHTDVEDDLMVAYSSVKNLFLPLRSDAIASLEQIWGDQSIISRASSIRLYYIESKILVELILPLKENETRLSHEMISTLTQKASDLSWFGRLDILYRYI